MSSTSGPYFSDASETLRQISDAVGISVWTWHAATNRVYNFATPIRGAVVKQGITLEDVLTQLHTGDRARVKRQLLKAVRNGRPGSFRFRGRAHGQHIPRYNATHFPIGPNQLQVIVQDVTRMQMAEKALRESVDHYRTSVALNPEVPWLADAGGLIIEVGPRWADLVGLKVEQTLGIGWTRVLHPNDLEPTLEAWARSLDTGEPLDIEYRLRHKSGTYRWMRARASPHRNKHGKIVRWYGTLEDIHERRQMEAALRESEAFSRSILEASTMAIEVLDAEGRLIFMNGPGMRIMEVEDFGSIKGRFYETFWPDDVKSTIRDAIVAARRGVTVRHTLFGPTAKGKARWWDFSLSPILDDEGTVARLLALSSDVTDAKYAEAEIAHLARHDALTGLPNRMHFQEGLEAALEALGEGDELVVMSVDLDDFKLVNDTLGHHTGDMLLREVAERLRLCAGGGNLVARLGGDEFALMLTVGDPEEASSIANAILAAVTQTIDLEGESVHIGASIGIARAPRDGRTAEAVLHKADVAMYRVKADKGRGYRHFDPAMDESRRKRRDMKRELSLALERDELSLVYQPQIDIGADVVVGFEALVRWTSALHGPVSPTDFVPLAEESGLIDEIGGFVLEQACAEAMHWPENISVAVNLSPMQFRKGGLVGAVTQALERTGLSARRLEVEITESVLFDESAEAVAALQTLHDLGIRVALDDFGTGYSSLSYLRRFPFDKIKIDRTFIADLPDAAGSAAIVRAILGLGRSLRTRVIAEGVESWEQLLLLRAEGCTEVQGYLFSPPLAAEEARALAGAGRLVARPQAKRQA